jgi:hypothetical protein
LWAWGCGWRGKDDNYTFLDYSVSACNVPQRLKPEGLISFTAGLKTCSTLPWDTVKFKRYKNEKEHAKLAACPVFLTSILRLHQKFICLPRDGMLHLFQFILHLVQAIHKMLKLLRHAAEKRRHLGILKVLKL